MGAVSDRQPSVFLQDFVDVPLPSDVVGQALAGEEGSLGPMADEAAADGHALLVRLGREHVPGGMITLRVQMGGPVLRGGCVMIPIRWEAARLPKVFPVLDGQLEVSPLGPAESRLLLQASYRPPLDGVGRLLDDTVLHRVAESTVRSFLHRLADAVVAARSGP